MTLYLVTADDDAGQEFAFDIFVNADNPIQAAKLMAEKWAEEIEGFGIGPVTVFEVPTDTTHGVIAWDHSKATAILESDFK